MFNKELLYCAWNKKHRKVMTETKTRLSEDPFFSLVHEGCHFLLLFVCMCM